MTLHLASVSAPTTQRLARAAIAAAALGVFLTWTSDGPVDLDGTQGPNNGWLVLLVAGLAAVWSRAMARGSLVGVIGVFGSAVVIGVTAGENWRDGRNVLGSTAAFGLLLVVAASVALAGVAVARGLALARSRKESAP